MAFYLCFNVINVFALVEYKAHLYRAPLKNAEYMHWTLIILRDEEYADDIYYF